MHTVSGKEVRKIEILSNWIDSVLRWESSTDPIFLGD